MAAGPLYELAERAAADLLDPTAYIEAVLRVRRRAAHRAGLVAAVGAAVGRLSVANVVSGAAVAAVLLVVFPAAPSGGRARRCARLALARLVAYFG